MNFDEHQRRMKRIVELQSEGILGPGTPEEKLNTNSSMHVDELYEAVYKKMENLDCNGIAALISLLFGKRVVYSGTLGNRHDVCFDVETLTPEQKENWLKFGKHFA